MKLQFEKEKATTLIIIAEKIMYGVVMLRIDSTKSGLSVSYTAIADGGEICGQERRTFAKKNIKSVISKISDIEYPDEQNEEMCSHWGVQIGDANNQLIAEVEQGYWDSEIILGIINSLERDIGACNAFNALRGVIEF